MDDKEFAIKEDGTIVRGPNLEELKRRINGKKTDDKDEPNKKASNNNNGCLNTFIGFVVFVLITTIIGGVIGFIVNKHESVEMGLLLGGLFGIAYYICSLIGELLNKK